MDAVTHNRGRNVAIVGAVLQLVLTVVALLLWFWTRSQAALACGGMLGGGVPLWLVAALLFYCRQLERREALEMEEIAAQGGSGTIFERPGGELGPSAARLRWFERWIVPLFTLLWAGYHVGVGVLMLRYLSWTAQSDIANAGQGVLFAVLLAFMGFLFSRYATGMGVQAEYRPLRAGGSYLLVNVLLVAALVAVLALAARGVVEGDRSDKYVAYAIPLVQLVLAMELLLNFVLDLYRPRLADQEQRLSFDSRLFNLLADPSRVGHSIAETVNYQFGFEVSKTWFYQLVGKAFVPMLALGALVMLAMTSIVVVEDGQQAVVFHWGKVSPEPLRAGVHFKWPWPIDAAERFDVVKVHEVLLGAGRERSREQQAMSLVNGKEIYLWSQEHGQVEERDFLVAVPPRQSAATPALGSQEKPPPPVNVIKLVVSVQYVIEDARKFGYKFVDAAKALQCEAYREMVSYCASATLDEAVNDADGRRPQAIMTFGRDAAARELKRRIGDAVGPRGLDIGVRITSVSFTAVHPPASAAGAYEAVLTAERRQDEQRYQAQAQANQLLTAVAGDPVTALLLATAIRTLEDLERLRQVQPVPAEFAAKIDELLRRNRQDFESLRKESQQDAMVGRGAVRTRQDLLAEHVKQQDLLRDLQVKAAAGQPVDLAAAISLAKDRADALFDAATGKPASEVAQAYGERWQYEMFQRSLAESARREMLPYNASPRLYMLDRWLDVWDQVLPGATKYVLGVDRNKVQLWMNLEVQQGVMQTTTFTPENTK